MNPLFLTDSYKLSHKGFMTEGTQVIYSNGTPRTTKYLPVPEQFKNKVVWFGMQRVLKNMNDMWNRNFFLFPKEVVMQQTERLFDAYLGKGAIEMDHFRELHDLGYLPIEIKALPEGSLVDVKVPFFTIKNTDERFAWLTNYLETWLSAELWKPTTVATIIHAYRNLANTWAEKTTGSTAGTEFQIHDFSYRGMSNTEDAAACGSAFLLSSCGTDNIPALLHVEKYYKTDITKEFIGTSVPASEHSLASTGIAVNGELETYRKWITKDYPTGIVSVIADTLDFFRVVTEFATALKNDILNRQPNELGLAKVVFRPDSGCPVKILTGYFTDGRDWQSVDEVISEYDYSDLNSLPEVVKIQGKYFILYQALDGRVDACKELSEAEVKGAVQCLWDIFGGTTTEQGFKQLHERVGLIYGDSITLDRAEQIFDRLAHKGFASTNVVLGVGSYTCQYLTRDSIGMAVKATAAKVNGEWYELSKDPKTDDGMKKSAKGLLRVERDGDNFVLYDQQSHEQEQQGELKQVYVNGQITKTVTFQEVRNNLWK